MFGRKLARPISFDLHTPLDGPTIRDHILHSLSLRLPEADADPLRTLTVVANGPSAADRRYEGPTLALNGALSLFAEGPTYWAGCDPQPLLAPMLADAPEATTYFVASKCHPSVFEALKGRDVRLWHVSDQDVPGARLVPCATSVTLSALMLMHRLGWRRFEIYGWDACFGSKGAHHAVEHGPILTDTVQIQVGNRTFASTPTWGAEAQNAADVLPVLEWCGAEINIHGPGMIAAIRRELRRAA